MIVMRNCGFAVPCPMLLALPAQAEPLSLRVASARAVVSAVGSGPVVQVTLAPDGSKALARFTRNHIGRQIQVTAAGRLVLSPVITSS